MSLGFSDLIWEIESELRVEYWPGAIAWADREHDNAWSKDLNYFDTALSEALRTKDYSHLRRQAEIYKKRILILLQWYKKSQNMEDQEEFFKSIEG